MANPTIYFDGDKKRIYEVPDLSSFIVDGNGYRIYTPDSLVGRVNEFVSLSFQIDIWSRFQDWHIDNEWSTIAIGRTGGASRGVINSVEVFASNDYQILSSVGWQFVPADYAHVLEIFGNVLSDQGGVTIFDTTRITASGVSQNVRMADSLQVAIISTGSGVTEQDKADIAAASAVDVWNDPNATSLQTDVDYIKGIEGGKWEIIGNQMVFYDDDNVTEISRFNLFDSNGNATTTGEVFKRERV